MPFIKFVNEENLFDPFYRRIDSISNLLLYMFRPGKIYEDTKRADSDINDYTGCEPFWFPREYEHDPFAVIEFMELAHRVNHHIEGGEFIKHRIVSFEAEDQILAKDLDWLGRAIVTEYANHGYIAVYAVHKDTHELHLHIAVNAIDFKGNKFHFSFEARWLWKLVYGWYRSHNEMLMNNIKQSNRYDRILYGEGRFHDGWPISAVEQIDRNYHSAHGIKKSDLAPVYDWNSIKPIRRKEF